MNERRSEIPLVEAAVIVVASTEFWTETASAAAAATVALPDGSWGLTPAPPSVVAVLRGTRGQVVDMRGGSATGAKVVLLSVRWDQALVRERGAAAFLRFNVVTDAVPLSCVMWTRESFAARVARELEQDAARQAAEDRA